MKKKNKEFSKNRILSLFLFAGIFFLQIGYGAINSTELKITGGMEAKVEETTFVVSAKKNGDSGYSGNDPIINDKGINLNFNLNDTNSYVTYEVVLTNPTNVNQKYTGITTSSEFYSNNDIIFNINGIDDESSFFLEPGETKKININFKYASDVTNVNNNNLNAFINFDFSEVQNNYLTYKTGKTTEVDIVFFNPIDNSECSKEEYSNSNSNFGISSGCLKWYIIKNSSESESNLNMILDHDLERKRWSANSTSYQTGPEENLISLKTKTERWKTFTPTDMTISSYRTSYTIDYSAAKARFITVEEISNIIGRTTTTANANFYLNASNNKNDKTFEYGWIIDRTSSDCNTYGCPNKLEDTSVKKNSNLAGYWTANWSTTSNYNAVKVSPQNQVLNVDYTTTPGIRPVIVVDKSRITTTYHYTKSGNTYTLN